MTERSIDEQLTIYLADVHAIEELGLTQLQRAREIAGDRRLTRLFREHFRETGGHQDRIRRRLEARGTDPSAIKDVAGKAGGLGAVAFAHASPDTAGKLTVQAYSYEHLEIAAYELLRRVAERAGDQDSAAVAHENLEQERLMTRRLEDCFDVAVDASLRRTDTDHLDAQLVKYLADAHAIEQQSIELGEKSLAMVKDDELTQSFHEHLQQTREHSRRIEERLHAHDSRPSLFEDTALRMAGLNVGAFFDAQPDTTAKVAGFAYSFEYLEVAAYELLGRVAERAGDPDTAEMAKEIGAEERAAAEALGDSWDRTVEASLAEAGVVS